MRKLGNQAWGRSGAKGQTKAENETRDTEHCKVLALALQNGTEYHNNAPNCDSPTSSESISNPWGNRTGADSTKCNDSRDQAKLTSSWFAKEIIPVSISVWAHRFLARWKFGEALPVRDCLKRVHHGTIIAASHIRDNSSWK